MYRHGERVRTQRDQRSPRAEAMIRSERSVALNSGSEPFFGALASSLDEELDAGGYPWYRRVAAALTRPSSSGERGDVSALGGKKIVVEKRLRHAQR